MKMRRRTGVNGVRENHIDTVVNQGGTAESFGPLSGMKARLFYEKIQGRILPRRNKNREERRGEHFMQEVNWDAVNLLELGMLLDMAKDGYEFQIADGRIKSIEVKLLS